DLHDVNIRFYLTAKGSVSQAQTTFFDAAAANVVFTTDSPCAVTGTASGTNNGGNPFTNTAFTTGKPSASFGTQPSTSVSYSYAPTVTCGAATYSFCVRLTGQPFYVRSGEFHHDCHCSLCADECNDQTRSLGAQPCLSNVR